MNINISVYSYTVSIIPLAIRQYAVHIFNNPIPSVVEYSYCCIPFTKKISMHVLPVRIVFRLPSDNVRRIRNSIKNNCNDNHPCSCPKRYVPACFLSTHRHPPKTVSVLILRPRDTSSVVTYHATEIIHRYIASKEMNQSMQCQHWIRKADHYT